MAAQKVASRTAANRSCGRVTFHFLQESKNAAIDMVTLCSQNVSTQAYFCKTESEYRPVFRPKTQFPKNLSGVKVFNGRVQKRRWADNSLKLPFLCRKHFIYCVILIFILIYVFPHFILVQPDRISVSSYELFCIHAIDCGWSLDPLLLAVHENGHVFFSPLLLRGFLFWSKLLLSSWHLRSYHCANFDYAAKMLDITLY